jgi:hypothetical protein
MKDPMARIQRNVSLRHRANLGEEVTKIDFAEGEEVTILKQWAHHYLIKDDEGRVFNVEKDLVSNEVET